VRWLEIAATFCLGLLAGAMLFIGAAVVPYWFSLEPPAFADWFARNASYFGAVMLPLGGVAALLAFAAALLAWRARGPGRVHFAAAAALAAVVGAIYLVEHASLNAAIVSGTLSPGEIVSARSSWRAWHWARTAAGTLGFLAALLALPRGRSTPARAEARAR
jgi:hypothetical protein